MSTPTGGIRFRIFSHTEVKIKVLIAGMLFAMAASGSQAVESPTTVLGAGLRGEGLNRLSYAGRWDFIHSTFDGRLHGESARSFHPGDNVTLLFKGRRLRIFGVTGPTGGTAGVTLGDGSAEQTISFYAERKHTHALVYSSGLMPEGERLARLVVRAASAPPRAYVNVDAFEISQDAQ